MVISLSLVITWSNSIFRRHRWPNPDPGRVPTTSPPPEDMHGGISYLREDLRDVKQDLRDFRREVAQEFADVRREFAQQLGDLRGEVTQQLSEHCKETGELRKEVAQQIADVRRDLRHNLYAMIGISGAFASIIIAFMEYRLPAG